MSVLQRRIAAKWPWPEGLRPKIAPSGVARLAPGMTRAGTTRLVWHDFALQRGAAPNGNTP
jgi:hypothetical protein